MRPLVCLNAITFYLHIIKLQLTNVLHLWLNSGKMGTQRLTINSCKICCKTTTCFHFKLLGAVLDMEKENFFDQAYSLKDAEDTKKMYDRWAKVYDQDLTNGEYQQPSRCAQALASVLDNKQISILDVGCGTGLSGLALREAGYRQIDGCDLSDGMLKKAAELEIYNRLFSCDLNEPPINATNEQYDAVTAVGVFSFGHISPDAVDELLRVLKSKGTLIIGLNDHYYDEGSLTQKLNSLEKHKKLSILKQEHGDHIPANNLKGWVLTLQKT